MKLSREKINLIMARKNLTVGDLADAYGASVQRIHVIFNSKKVAPLTAGKMATALGVDVTEIIEN